jgi:phage/conjugal plasmid C-4 type zinc finger TraR family protein
MASSPAPEAPGSLVFRRGLVYAGNMSKGFGESDFAQVQSEKATTESVRRLLDENLRQAQRATSRRAEGAYGVCEDCGQAISAERLEFLPDATRCVTCQARQEQG